MAHKMHGSHVYFEADLRMKVDIFVVLNWATIFRINLELKKVLEVYSKRQPLMGLTSDPCKAHQPS